MAKNSKNGMPASEHDKWIEKNSFEIDAFTRDLFEAFVVGTPSYGLSAKGRDFYIEYSMSSPSDYKQLWDKLCAGFTDCLVAYTKEDVKNQIASSSILNFNSAPKAPSEAFCIFVGNKYQDDEFYKQYFASAATPSSKGKTKQEIQRESEEKWSIAYVNKLFRHLRNSLAHGRFALINHGTSEYYIFEDELHDEITARILITRNRLENWIEIFKKENSVNSSNLIEGRGGKENDS